MPANPLLTVSARCDEVIARHDLLRHPFYVAWAEGTLPVSALLDYAREYGAFIATIGQGWEAIGDPAAARVEDRHARVWERMFATALGTAVGAPRVDAVSRLVDVARQSFVAKTSALGALYAFEAQQPSTALTKLRGLREHYHQLPESCGEYFRLHDDDYGEAALLGRQLDALEPAEQQQAVDACDRMGRALYDALTGIHAPHVNRDRVSIQ